MNEEQKETEEEEGEVLQGVKVKERNLMNLNKIDIEYNEVIVRAVRV